MAKQSKREFIVSTWRKLRAERVGKKELSAIQEALKKEFGTDMNSSPAATARVLADEGAELKHPEIIEYDARWRESQISRDAPRFSALEAFTSTEPLDLPRLEQFLQRVEDLRVEFELQTDRNGLAQLRTLVLNQRLSAQSRAADQMAAETYRTEQREVLQWLTVWLQTPKIFSDWVELRRRSDEFRALFASPDQAQTPSALEP